MNNTIKRSYSTEMIWRYILMDRDMQQGSDYKYIPMTSIQSRTGEEVAGDVYYYTDQIANICMIGNRDEGEWVLMDAGLPYGAEEIIETASKRFGNGAKPRAIILTHGHFDHVGGLVDLIKKWDVPVYAHPFEFPFLTGEKRYPEPDGGVEGGLLAKISPMYPNEPINIRHHLRPLPEDQSVPHAHGWKWVHTPGHSPGHVSFFRESDSLLLSGDAFITVKQDSFYKVLMQTPEVQGPPRYLTTDWKAAWESVKKLAALQPKKVVPGHGQMMHGEKLQNGLERLTKHFNSIAIPEYGRYVDDSLH